MSRLILACFAVILLGTMARAQEGQDEPLGEYVHMKNSEGTDFWVCFMKNYKEGNDGSAEDSLTLELFFTANESSRISIDIQGLRYHRELTVQGGTVASLYINEKAQLGTVMAAQNLAIHITSDFPISVYGLNRRFQTTDTYLALPVDVLGKEYRTVCYNKLSQELISQVAVVATEDGTDVTVVPTSRVLGGHPVNKPFVLHLQRGEVYQLIADFGDEGMGDLTGSLVSANKKIAVFSGHSCAYVPTGVSACNHLVEQLPPVSAWGEHFYVGMLKGRSRYTLRVVAHQNRTRVFEDSRLVSVLNAGEFYENLNVRKHVQITADKPVLVAQYSQGFKNGDSVGDPMMILISPTQQFVSRYRVATPVKGSWDHYMNIVIPTTMISTLRLDGNAVPLSSFETLGLSRYSIAQLKVDFGTHVVFADVPFGLYLYGFGYKGDAFDAYGNMGGQSFFDLDYSKDTLAPIGETRPDKGGTSLIIRDDRNNDGGLKSVRVLTAVGMNTSIPTIEEGTPQVLLRLRPNQENTNAKIVIRATDVAGNVATYTVCYTQDAKGHDFTYHLCPDGQDCDFPMLWSVSVFSSVNSTFHHADFSTAGSLHANGKFGDASGGSGYGGLSVTRHLRAGFAITAGLSLEGIGGTLHAPDSTIFQTRDSSGVLVPYQEERLLAVHGPLLSLRCVAEYSFLQNLYGFGGFSLQMLTSKSITYQRHILQPSNVTFSNGSSTVDESPQELASLSSMRMAFLGGMGFSVPVAGRLHAYSELEVCQPLSDLVSDSNGSWSTWSLGFHIGLRLHL